MRVKVLASFGVTGPDGGMVVHPSGEVTIDGRDKDQAALYHQLAEQGLVEILEDVPSAKEAAADEPKPKAADEPKSTSRATSSKAATPPESKSGNRGTEVK